MKICPRCNTVNPITNRLCAGCGYHLDGTNPAKTTVSSGKRWPAWQLGLLTGALLTSLVLGGLIFLILNLTEPAQVESIVTPSPVSPSPAPTFAIVGDPWAGLAVFKAAGCSGCHANLGKAAGGVGPRVAGTTRDDQSITTLIRQGQGAMPAHSSEELSDTDVTNVIAYIRSLTVPSSSLPSRPTSTPAIGSPGPTPTVQPTTAFQAGLALFKAAGCSGCHANLGKAAGGVGPKLAGTKRDDQYIANIIRNGKNAMPAHSPDEVSDQDITSLIAYIRGLTQ